MKRHLGLLATWMLFFGPGCAAVAVGAVAGAGAVGAVAYSQRGAKGDVKGGVEQVRRQTELTFAQMGINTTATASKNAGAEQDLQGKVQGMDVSVKIVAVSPQVSHVEVEARSGSLSWDKDYARNVLSRIVQQPG
jgi:hypothetical protein